jgi:hypothetical protein
MPTMSIAPATIEKRPRTRKRVEMLLPASLAAASAFTSNWSTTSPCAIGIAARVVFRVELTLGASESRLAWSPTLVTVRKLMAPE